MIAAHDNIPVPALISLTPLSEAAERLKHTSGSETLYSDCQCDLRRFYLPGWLDEARTGLLTCLPLHLACYADVCLVLKDCLFILDFGIFSTGLNASDVCWLCVGGGGGEKKASSFIWQFETEFSCWSCKLKDFYLMLSLQTAFPPLLIWLDWFSLLPFSPSMSTAV